MQVHERTLQGDFLMALLCDIVAARRSAGNPLKVRLFCTRALSMEHGQPPQAVAHADLLGYGAGNQCSKDPGHKLVVVACSDCLGMRCIFACCRKILYYRESFSSLQKCDAEAGLECSVLHWLDVGYCML